MTGARPASLEEALALLAARPELVPVHGGTDVMVPVNAGRRRVAGWLSLRSVDELRGVGSTADGDVADRAADPLSLRIGAGTTFAELLAHGADSATSLPDALVAAARTVGSPQIRAAGTIGGNVATASPAADAVPPLLCFDAEVELVSAAGRRRVPLATFAHGPKSTVRRADELIVALHLPSVTGDSVFAKVGTRNAMVISVCSIAARLDREAGVARLALGSVGPTVLAVPEAEAVLLDPRGADDLADLIRGACTPIDDVRATAAYRRHAVGVLARRVHGWLWSSRSQEAA